MRFKEKDILGLHMRTPHFKKVKQQIMEAHMKSRETFGMLSEDLQERKRILDYLFDDKVFTDFYLTATAQEVAQSIKVPEDMDFRWLASRVPLQAHTYMIGTQIAYRYIRTKEDILVLFIMWEPVTQPGYDHYMQYESFRISFKDNELKLPDSPKAKERAYKFIKYVFFMELADKEIVLLPPGKKEKIEKEPYKNDSPLPFKLVHANWNKLVIRTEGFPVRGHVRIQKVGRELADRKLVFIQPYEKKGYMRGPTPNSKPNTHE